MLTIFIIPSYAKNANVRKTIASFAGIDGGFRVVSVLDCSEINRYNKKDDWFGVFWDNEYIEHSLKGALPIFLSYPDLEVLVLYKKEGVVEATWRKRVFRKNIFLVDDCRPLCLWENKEAILDGWVKEHDTSEIRLLSV
jgi:hypothetical protein